MRAALRQLVALLCAGHAHVSVAQCLADAARVARDLERALDAKRDAAIRADVAARLTDEPPHIPSWIRK